ncbi:MAG: hypothetical protein SPL08_05065 [Pseudomonadota bacterium]|nr:hypothetical protein [Pseudomonadota bacterium]
MFDVTESIEEGYLWNFSVAERRSFYRQHRSRQDALSNYVGRLTSMVSQEDSAMFANDEPCPSTPLEIKYTFNRIYMNDSREKELTLNRDDPPAPANKSYAKKISWAFEFNTCCRTVVLNGVQTRDGWHKRGFNDEEASCILDALSNKKLTELTFASYPLLTDITYLKIANILMSPQNCWQHVTLGDIPVASDIADIYDRTNKVSYRRIKRPPKNFLFRIFHNGMKHERS